MKKVIILLMMLIASKVDAKLKYSAGLGYGMSCNYKFNLSRWYETYSYSQNVDSRLAQKVFITNRLKFTDKFGFRFELIKEWNKITGYPVNLLINEYPYPDEYAEVFQKFTYNPYSIVFGLDYQILTIKSGVIVLGVDVGIYPDSDIKMKMWNYYTDEQIAKGIPAGVLLTDEKTEVESVNGGVRYGLMCSYRLTNDYKVPLEFYIKGTYSRYSGQFSGVALNKPVFNGNSDLLYGLDSRLEFELGLGVALFK